MQNASSNGPSAGLPQAPAGWPKGQKAASREDRRGNGIFVRTTKLLFIGRKDEINVYLLFQLF
ncbi:hypothetical protein IB49_18620 (plasmid) [Geobacillus sp. LC300]|nr:hypothetical protein IB49_18620 [Geobacillus sp. LC300]